jgi:hypothetical protein
MDNLPLLYYYPIIIHSTTIRQEEQLFMINIFNAEKVSEETEILFDSNYKCSHPTYQFAQSFTDEILNDCVSAFDKYMIQSHAEFNKKTREIRNFLQIYKFHCEDMIDLCEQYFLDFIDILYETKMFYTNDLDPLKIIDKKFRLQVQIKNNDLLDTQEEFFSRKFILVIFSILCFVQNLRVRNNWLQIHNRKKEENKIKIQNTIHTREKHENIFD